MGALPSSTEIQAPVSLRTHAYRLLCQDRPGWGGGGFARSATYARSTVPLERLLGGAVTQPHLT